MGQNMTNSLIFSQLSRNANLSTFSTTRHNDSTAHTFRTPRCFIQNNTSNECNTSNKNSSSVLPKPPPSLLESSGSFTNGFSTNDRISDSLDAKFLNKLCEEIEVSLNVDCECADDYSSNDFSGDYSFDHELKSSPMPIRFNTPTTQMKTYLNENVNKGGIVGGYQRNVNDKSLGVNVGVNYKNQNVNQDLYDNQSSQNTSAPKKTKNTLGVLV